MKIKKLKEIAKIPTRGTDYAAGYDMYAAIDEAVKIEPHTTVMISTGIAIEIPKNYFGAIYARSGLALREGLRPAQGTAVIDEDYRGEIRIPLHNDTDKLQTVEPGERVAQIVFQKYLAVDFEVVDELSNTQRGAGGFGSTGMK